MMMMMTIMLIRQPQFTRSNARPVVLFQSLQLALFIIRYVKSHHNDDYNNDYDEH